MDRKPLISKRSSAMGAGIIRERERSSEESEESEASTATRSAAGRTCCVLHVGYPPESRARRSGQPGAGSAGGMVLGVTHNLSIDAESPLHGSAGLQQTRRPAGGARCEHLVGLLPGRRACRARGSACASAPRDQPRTRTANADDVALRRASRHMRTHALRGLLRDDALRLGGLRGARARERPRSLGARDLLGEKAHARTSARAAARASSLPRAPDARPEMVARDRCDRRRGDERRPHGRARQEARHDRRARRARRGASTRSRGGE